MTHSEFLELIGAWRDNWPRDEIRKGRAEFLAECLMDLPYAAAAAALRSHAAESPFPPTVHDLRRRATRPADLREADEAWGEVYRAIREVGRYRVPTFSTPEIAQTVEVMNWDVLCSSLEEDLPTLRAQFERYYRARLERRLTAENSGRLLHENHVRELRDARRALGDGDASGGGAEQAPPQAGLSPGERHGFGPVRVGDVLQRLARTTERGE